MSLCMQLKQQKIVESLCRLDIALGFETPTNDQEFYWQIPYYRLTWRITYVEDKRQ